jgi:hypothetical protein
MPTPKYYFVCPNHLERAYAIELLINLAAWRLGEIRF